MYRARQDTSESGGRDRDQQRAEYQVNSTIIELYWAIGEYVSKQIEINGWGKSTVKALSEYILGREPGIRGYSA